MLTAKQRISPNRDPKILPVEACIWHYTATDSDTISLDTLTMSREAIDKYWAKIGKKGKAPDAVSAHFVITKKGCIWQLVPLSKRAVHAGGPHSKLHGKGAVNSRTIGVEVVNSGPKSPYTLEQTEAIVRLAKWLAEQIPVLADPTNHLGHSETNPKKQDPGPLFPWKELRSVLK